MGNFKLLFSVVFLTVIFSGSGFGQKIKVSPLDTSLVPKIITQNRNLTKYFDGGTFRCGYHSSGNECDYKQLRNVIWQCWSEKTKCYLTIESSSVDAGEIEHIFIEPGKNNKWLIIRRTENSRTNHRLGKSLQNLPLVYFVEWRKSDSEQILIFKNKMGKAIEEF